MNPKQLCLAVQLFTVGFQISIPLSIQLQKVQLDLTLLQIPYQQAMDYPSTILLLTLACSIVLIQGQDRSFVIEGDSFMKDGEPFTIISGSLHYFRVMPDKWNDRLRKMKLGGLNTVCTYIPWNLHQPTSESDFNFEGILDLEKFIEEAQKHDLLVILRPSPYICAEWEFGGLPSWLLADSDIELRCSDSTFMNSIAPFFDVLMPKIAPFQYSLGGPVIAMQIENEYGSYGNDQDYMEFLKSKVTEYDIDVVLFMSNGADSTSIHGGSLDDPSVLRTVNFGAGTNVSAAFQTLRQWQPTGPLFVTEFWVGWFDHWGEHHHVVSSESVAETLNAVFSYNASVNFYMYHGGTNFGFMNGANSDPYQPTVTSYDYDAPLNESGDPTPKFYVIRDMVNSYLQTDFKKDDVVDSAKGSYGTIQMASSVSLVDSLPVLSSPVSKVNPLNMEKLGQDYGFIWYRTTIRGPINEVDFYIQDVRDRAMVFLNGDFQGIAYRSDPAQGIPLGFSESTATLDILVENLGRINFGSSLRDPKGISQGVRLGGQFQYGWTIYTLPLSNISALQFESPAISMNNNPTFYEGSFQVSDNPPLDTFLLMDGWLKGVVWVNGFNIGRYWHIGPQRTLYVPSSILKYGMNTVQIFELEGQQQLSIQSQSWAELDRVD